MKRIHLTVGLTALALVLCMGRPLAYAQETEICNDMIDNNGDGLIDCQDAACRATVGCSDFNNDPGRITLRQRPYLDVLRVHGHFTSATPLDPIANGVGILLANANGDVFRANLQPGDMIARGKGIWSFRSSAASAGGGVASLQIVKQRKLYLVYLVAYGDLTAATVPSMYFEIVAGGEVGWRDANWTRTSNGWLTGLR